MRRSGVPAFALLASLGAWACSNTAIGQLDRNEHAAANKDYGLIVSTPVTCAETDSSPECVNNWAVHGEAHLMLARAAAAHAAMCPSTAQKDHLKDGAREIGLAIAHDGQLASSQRVSLRRDHAWALYCLANFSASTSHDRTLAAAADLMVARDLDAGATGTREYKTLAAAIAEHAKAGDACDLAKSGKSLADKYQLAADLKAELAAQAAVKCPGVG